MSELLNKISDPMLRRAMVDAIMAEMSIPLARMPKTRLHTKAMCKETRKSGGPKGCVLHRPTLHRLTGSRQILRSTTLVEDECQHGVGHPNPDSVDYLNWRDAAWSWGVHGCDGCCGPAE